MDEEIKQEQQYLPEVALERTTEEVEWNTIINTSHVREGLRRLAREARRQITVGETEEGGFAVE